MAPSSDGSIDTLRFALTLRKASSELGLDLGDRQVEQLLDFLRLLRRWNAIYNLTSIRDPEQMLTHHVIDSLACVGPLRRETGGENDVRLLDVGSGGGLPGAVVAIAAPQMHVTCIDTVGKKAAFVSQAASALMLPNLQSKHGRVEDQPEGRFEVVASRAFSSLSKFVELTVRQLSPRGKWMAMKGRRPEDEIKQLSSTTQMFHVEPLRVPGLDAERCLVWMGRAS